MPLLKTRLIDCCFKRFRFLACVLFFELQSVALFRHNKAERSRHMPRIETLNSARQHVLQYASSPTVFTRCAVKAEQ